MVLLTVYINNKHIKITQPIISMQKMSKIFYVAKCSLLCQDTVSHIIVTFLTKHCLRLNFILNLMQILRINHTSKCIACKVSEFLKRLTPKHANYIFFCKENPLLLSCFINEKTSRKSGRSHTICTNPYRHSSPTLTDILCHNYLRSHTASYILETHCAFLSI